MRSVARPGPRRFECGEQGGVGDGLEVAGLGVPHIDEVAMTLGESRWVGLVGCADHLDHGRSPISWVGIHR